MAAIDAERHVGIGRARQGARSAARIDGRNVALNSSHVTIEVQETHGTFGATVQRFNIGGGLKRQPRRRWR
jgi:hypothetical protein